MASFEFVKNEKVEFEMNSVIYDKALVTFKGVDGWDVYNCSVPFQWKGQTHIFGRVEKRAEWANSFVRLFVETGKDEFTLVADNISLQLEDPFVTKIDGIMYMGGTHILKSCGKVSSYYTKMFKGGPELIRDWNSGPDLMKDIRLITLANNKIGVFSRPKTVAHAFIGFTIVDHVDQVTEQLITKAPPLNVLHTGSWGGVNQPYLLSSGKIGCISHYSYTDRDETGAPLMVYVNYSFVVDPYTREVENAKIIGTKASYPPCEVKVKKLVDCVFASGIVMRSDGKADMYSGLGDAYMGRITIDYPFEGCGTIVDNLRF